jgi:membrane protease YdiL (CAAX protease family)
MADRVREVDDGFACPRAEASSARSVVGNKAHDREPDDTPAEADFWEAVTLFPAMSGIDGDGRRDSRGMGGEPGNEIPGRPDMRATWRPIEAIPVYLIAVLGAYLVGATASRATGSRSGRFIIVTVAGELAFLGAVLLWVRYVNKGPLQALGLPRHPLGDVTDGILMGVALVLVGAATLWLVQRAAIFILGHPPPSPEQVPAYVRGRALAYLAPGVIVLAPLGEEAFFRGFLYKSLRNRLPVWPAAVASALIFGALHYMRPGSLVLIPPLFVVGLGLALVYERRQSLLASVAAHATFNLVGYAFIVLSRR